MKKLFVLFSLALALWAPEAAAQARTVTGRVTVAETGAPIPGVSVSVPGTSIGTLTNSDGRYTVNVPPNANSLSFRSLAYGSRDVQITGTELNVSLEAQAVALEGVVVTALGMERQARTLGVAAEQVSGEELTRVETNVVNSLSGKVSGINITGASTPGGSSRIVIRGESSITGNNQPLFVIDGIPVDNYTGGTNIGASAQAGYDYGNAMQDINPEAIEAITVLKGPNAAALYGSRASNGAIIITTKNGRNAIGAAQIVASQTVTFEDELRLPNYQNAYGQGLYGQYAYVDGDNNGVYDGEDQSWGPPLDVGLEIPQWHSPIDPATGERVALPWVSSPGNVDEYFEVGNTLTTNVSVAAGNEQMHGRFGASYLNQNGMVPGFELGRTTLSFGGGMDATERLNLNTSIQYVTSDGKNRPGIAYNNSNPMSQFIWFGRQVDTGLLRQRWDEVFPEGDPNEGLPQNWQRHYWSNPYQLQFTGRNVDERNRLIGQLSANYQLTDWLTATGRTGTDWYQDSRMKGYGANLYGGVYTTNPHTLEREYVDFNTGAFGSWEIGFQEINSDFLLNANPDLDLPFSVNATLGGNRRDVERRTDYVWVGELATPDIFDVSNAAITPDPYTYTSRKRVNSLYGQTELGYNDFLFLTLTGRNDWSSTLPEDNRSYFYPSVSGSFVFTDAIAGLGDTPWLGYGKLRASWARVGNDTDPYQLRNTFIADQKYGEFPTFEVPGQLNNAGLRPEITESWEFGTELAALDNRVGLDLTYYTAKTFDQIMPVSISRATGHTSRMVNAGTVQNQGWEVLLRASPIQTRDFRWESTVTWSKNNNKVLDLAEGVEGLEMSIGDFWGAQVFAREGEPLGQIVGTDYLRVDDPGSEFHGEKVIHPLGIYRWTPTPQVIGNFNPDWRAGFANEFSYRGASLNFLFDVKQGGEVFSVTHMFGRYAGVLEETVAGRCLMRDPDDADWAPLPGYPECSAETGIVPEGVLRTITDGDTTYVRNATTDTLFVDSEFFQNTQYYVSASNIVDAGFVKLREATLSYALPQTFTSRLGISGLDVALVGRNLLLWTENDHIDPETAFDSGNVQGFEYGQMPPARSVGFSISVRP